VSRQRNGLSRLVIPTDSTDAEAWLSTATAMCAAWLTVTPASGTRSTATVTQLR
jgi:hypothetical protein